MKSKFIWPLLIGAVLLSCGPTHKLRKAQKLIRQAEAEGAKVRVDTVYQEKTVEVKGPHTTLTVFRPGKDTTIFQDRIKITYIHRHDTLLQRIECPDTVVKWRQAVAVKQTIECPPANHTWRTIALVLIGLLTLLVVFVARR